MSESLNTPTSVGTTQPPIADHTAFICHRRKTISSLNLTMEEYEHRATGAMHYHLTVTTLKTCSWLLFEPYRWTQPALHTY